MKINGLCALLVFLNLRVGQGREKLERAVNDKRALGFVFLAII